MLTRCLFGWASVLPSVRQIWTFSVVPLYILKVGAFRAGISRQNAIDRERLPCMVTNSKHAEYNSTEFEWVQAVAYERDLKWDIYIFSKVRFKNLLRPLRNGKYEIQACAACRSSWRGLLFETSLFEKMNDIRGFGLISKDARWREIGQWFQPKYGQSRRRIDWQFLRREVGIGSSHTKYQQTEKSL
jgi:hypothetical protein